jgi:hypothetical protein
LDVSHGRASRAPNSRDQPTRKTLDGELGTCINSHARHWDGYKNGWRFCPALRSYSNPTIDSLLFLRRGWTWFWLRGRLLGCRLLWLGFRSRRFNLCMRLGSSCLSLWPRFSGGCFNLRLGFRSRRFNLCLRFGSSCLSLWPRFNGRRFNLRLGFRSRRFSLWSWLRRSYCRRLQGRWCLRSRLRSRGWRRLRGSYSGGLRLRYRSWCRFGLLLRYRRCDWRRSFWSRSLSRWYDGSRLSWRSLASR